MAEIDIPRRPIETEPISAIIVEPGESALEAKEDALLAALEGVELAAYDRVIIGWLAGWESSTVAVVCSWLHRVGEAPDA
ncbi:hypothetical protein ACIBEJ_34830 [Nonomuraea sp. NPDC050790]|uniref:hypothetical protein n=1 Tax=Nonomuraea sp. NPDC050790 TaxID=3364371 RepID=UPI0037B4486E